MLRESWDDNNARRSGKEKCGDVVFLRKINNCRERALGGRVRLDGGANGALAARRCACGGCLARRGGPMMPCLGGAFERHARADRSERSRWSERRDGRSAARTRVRVHYAHCALGCAIAHGLRRKSDKKAVRMRLEERRRVSSSRRTRNGPKTPFLSLWQAALRGERFKKCATRCFCGENADCCLLKACFARAWVILLPFRRFVPLFLRLCWCFLGGRPLGRICRCGSCARGKTPAVSGKWAEWPLLRAIW